MRAFGRGTEIRWKAQEIEIGLYVRLGKKRCKKRKLGSMAVMQWEIASGDAGIKSGWQATSYEMTGGDMVRQPGQCF